MLTGVFACGTARHCNAFCYCTAFCDGPTSRFSRCHLLLRFLCWLGDLSCNFARSLVFTQTFEGGLAHVAIASPAGELDFRHEFRLHPVNVRRGAWCARPFERTVLALNSLEFGQQCLDLLLAEAGAHATHV